jgi:hypothetical protein
MLSEVNRICNFSFPVPFSLHFSHVPDFSSILDWDEDGTIYNHFQLPETQPPPFLRQTTEYLATYGPRHPLYSVKYSRKMPQVIQWQHSRLHLAMHVQIIRAIYSDIISAFCAHNAQLHIV